jgi:uncharacterized protein YcbK (DUF882 family)
MSTAPERGRRQFLAFAAGAMVTAVAAPAIAAPRAPLRRSVALGHLQTGENLDIVYWADGHYQPGALQRINRLMRDYRTDQIHPINPRLVDLLSALQERLRVSAPFLVVSGYRSPASNALLVSTSEGVATNSFHMAGSAVDIRVQGRPLGAAREAAMSLKAGGVGYYPHSNFIHLDVGQVRHW